MRIELVNIDTLAPLILKITHNGEDLRFFISGFTRPVFQKEFDVFAEINQYWAYLSEQKNNEIFSKYKLLRTVLNTNYNISDLNKELRLKIKELIDTQDLNELHNWVVFKSTLAIPNNIDAEFVYDVDKQGTKSRTYLKSDYAWLLALSVMYRSIIPIWGEYIGQTRHDYGTDFKEYYAFKLLEESSLMHSEPIEKLKVYIEQTVGNEKNNPASILDGISSEHFPKWMMAIVSIRRLSVGDLRGIDANANLVTFVYKYIRHKAEKIDNVPDEIIRTKKTAEGASVSEENKISVLERYKIRHEIAIGDISEQRHALRDLREIAFSLAPNMTNEIFERSQRSVVKLQDHQLMLPQVTLLRWIFKPIVSPKGLMYVDKNVLVQAMGVVESVLWCRGHKYLAMLSTTYANLDSSEHFVSGMDAKAKLPKNLSEQISILYPYQKASVSRTEERRLSVDAQKITNPAIKAIQNVTDHFSKYAWVATCSNEMRIELLGDKNNLKVQVPYDIKTHLALVIIEIGSRSWKNK